MGWISSISKGTSAPMSRPMAREKATRSQRGPLAHSPPQSPVHAKTAYSAIALHPPTSASSASSAPKAAAACRRSRLARSEPMPIAKTMTDSTTEAWVTESPIKYEARATSSSSYTSPQAAQTKTQARTRKRPVPGRTGSRAGPAQDGGAPGGAGACDSITLRRYVTDAARFVTHTCGTEEPPGHRGSRRSARCPDRDPDPDPCPCGHQLPFLRIRVPGPPVHLPFVPLGQQCRERER